LITIIGSGMIQEKIKKCCLILNLKMTMLIIGSQLKMTIKLNLLIN
jgi:hypothetical protein